MKMVSWAVMVWNRYRIHPAWQFLQRELHDPDRSAVEINEAFASNCICTADSESSQGSLERMGFGNTITSPGLHWRTYVTDIALFTTLTMPM